MAIDSDLIRGHVDTIILKTLASGEKYGFEIIEEIQKKSSGTYELKQPTLYSCLKRLESQGLISSYWVNSEIGGRRHYYKLTDKGIEEYNNNINNWVKSRTIIDSLIGDESSYNDNNNNQPQDLPQLLQQDSNNNQTATKDVVIPTQLSISNSAVPDLTQPEANPYMLQEQQNGIDSLTDDVDYSVIADYYKTDDNQINIFTPTALEEETNLQTENQYNKTENNIDNYINEPDNQLAETPQSLNEYKTISDEHLKELTDNNYNKKSTKFNLKDYKKNNSSYFSEAKNQVYNYEELEINQDEIPPVIQQNDNENSQIDEETLFNEEMWDMSTINSGTDFNEDLTSKQELTQDNIDDNQNSYYSSDIFDSTYQNNEQQQVENNLYSDAEESDGKLDFGNGFEDYNNEQTEEYISNDDHYLNLFSEVNSNNYAKIDGEQNQEELDYNVNTDYNEDELLNDLERSDEPEQIFTDNRFDTNFILNNIQDDQNKYDYDEPEQLSNSTEIVLKQSYNSPEPKQDSTLALFSDRTKSFTPQYTDNDSKQVLNTLSSYGAVRFMSEELKVNESKLGLDFTSIEELQDNLEKEGITVRAYKKREPDPEDSRRFILVNKIKFVTSLISYSILALLLALSYFVADKIGYTDISLITTTKASTYFIVFGAIMFAIPAYYAICFVLNRTKKVRPKYSTKLAIVFAFLFFIQCLIIIYVLNIPMGLVKLTQLDYNHLLWFVPSVCSCYIIIHTLCYSILFKSKKFHI